MKSTLQFKDADMLVSSEIYQTTSVAEGLEGLSGARHGVNIGVMFLRPRALSLVQVSGKGVLGNQAVA